MFYNARWYDSSLGRFAQADSILSGGIQGYDRYAYVGNNPIKYTDPTGHMRIQDGKQRDRYSQSVANKYVPIRRPRFDREIGLPSVVGSIVVGFRFPEENVQAFSEMLEESYENHNLNPGKDIYKQPNSFDRMTVGDKAVYSMAGFSVIADQLKANAPRGIPPENVYVMVNWQSQNGRFAITDLDLINFTKNWAGIGGVLIKSNDPIPLSYGPSPIVGYNGNLPGTINYPLGNVRQFSVDESVFVKITVVLRTPSIDSQVIRISGSNLFPASSMPDLGPWITSP